MDAGAGPRDSGGIPLRIALFSEVFLPKIDGIVTRLIHTAHHLVRQGHEVLVFAPRAGRSGGHADDRHPLGDDHLGYRVVRVPSVPAWPIYPEVRVSFPGRQVAQELRAFRPDVVHVVNPFWLGGFGSWVAKRSGYPVVASFHTDMIAYASQWRGLGWLRPILRHWTKWMHSGAVLNLATSQQMVERCTHLGLANVHLWPKGVDTQRYRPDRDVDAVARMRERLTDSHPGQPLLIYVGRLSYEKSLTELFDVISALPHCRLALVGSGPAQAELERAFAGTNTVFTGYLFGEELADAYACADLFLFPSTTETLGLVALESMASGVPVIGARAGGIPFVVDDEKTGVLVEAHRPDLVVEAVRSLLEDASRLGDMKAAARDAALRCSWESATAALVDYYRDARASHPS